ncbi:MAG: glycosyltransferase, partial [Bacteroidota bacterium]
MKRVILTVTNDLTTDQRVDRVCRSLVRMGFEVTLVGRRLKNSQPLADRPYHTKRIHLLFTNGPQFYAEINFRFFFLLLFSRVDLLVS